MTAYKTYFKLLKTNITKYKVQKNLLSSNGYLVCNKCNNYYKLQPGESPEDPQNLRFWDPENEVFKGFTDKCECGGNLRFVKDLNDVNKF